MRNIAFIITNVLPEIQRVKQVLAQYACDRQIGHDAVYDINLILEEILSNIILYGYEDDLEHQIEVRISFTQHGGSMSFCKMRVIA